MKTALNNSSYLFIPFRFDRAADYTSLIRRICNGDKWEFTIDKNQYMFKYVFDKISSPSLDKTKSAHFILTDKGAQASGITLGESCGFSDNKRSYRFALEEVHAFLFSTSVGIAAFRLTFDESDPFVIAAAQYHMKKVYTRNISGSTVFTLEELTASLISGLLGSEPDIFFYADKGKGRANFLTYLEMNRLDVGDKSTYEKALFYLLGCYHDGFVYSDAVEDTYSESYVASHDKIWGISPNAAVCITSAESSKSEFNKTTFYSNFNTNYLMMYVLLLHRRFVSYMFLTDATSSNNGIEELEDYKERFADFENSFVFADLAELREKEEDREEKQSEKSMSSALTAISLLTIISAITDAISIGITVNGAAHPALTAVISVVLILLIGGAVGWFIGQKINSRNKKIK